MALIRVAIYSVEEGELVNPRMTLVELAQQVHNGDTDGAKETAQKVLRHYGIRTREAKAETPASSGPDE